MHFFTEPSKLVQQKDATAYGVVDDSRYNVAATFYVSGNTKIFACQDSKIIVQPYKDVDTGNISNNLVNVILKPIHLQQRDGRVKGLGTVQYYIYRGVDKNSFFTANNNIIEPDAATASDFIRKFWRNWNNQDTNPENVAPTSGNLGFDLSLDEETFLEEIFNEQINSVQAIEVKEGEWIGNISPEIEFNFEIIVDTDHLVLDLFYAQKSKHIIDVSGFPDITSQDKFKIKAEREKILNYIDPAAFFGLHYNTGIAVSTFSGETQATVTKTTSEIYTEILSKFHTKNRVYLDIRSERGYSYNYYENYGDTDGYIVNRRISIGTPIMLAPMKYEYWPILWLADFRDLTHSSPFNQLIFQLRVDDNLKPLVFVENASLLGDDDHTNFIQEKALLNDTDSGWTSEIILFYPNYSNPDDTSETNLDVAHYLKLQYFRQTLNQASPDNPVFGGSNYWDSAFGGIHIPAFRLSSPLGHDSNSKRYFLQGSNFAYVADTGFFNDSDLILFYAKNSYSLRKSGSFFPEISISEVVGGPIVNSAVFRGHPAYSKWQVNDGTQNIDILQLVGYRHQVMKTTPMEDFVYLGLTRAELAILDSLDGISNLHHKYFLFEEITHLTDARTNVPFKEYSLKVQGLNSSGVVTTIEPPTPVFVHGSSLNILCSKNFAASVNLPILTPDPVKFQTEVNFGKINLLKESIGGDTWFNIDDFNNNISADDNVGVELNSRLYFPTEKKGIIENIADIKKGTFPLIVIVHGNGHKYEEYDFVMEHLAMNSFIVASIDVANFKENEIIVSQLRPPYQNYFSFFLARQRYFYNSSNFTFFTFEEGERKYMPSSVSRQWLWYLNSLTNPAIFSYPTYVNFDLGLAALGRANILFKHLEVIRNKFSTTNSGSSSLNGKLGLIGHSRGGEAILTAERLLSAQSAISSFFTIDAIFSLAPTDQYHIETLTNVPYFVLYGSKDGDLVTAGISLGEGKRPDPETGEKKEVVSYTGFSLWDRATEQEKTMAFVLGATHNGFVTANYRDFLQNLIPFLTGRLGHIATETIQRNILKLYTNAFFRKYLLDGEKNVWDTAIKGVYRSTTTIDNRTTINTQLLGFPAANVYKIGENNKDIDFSDGQITAVLRLNFPLGGNINSPFDIFSPHGDMATMLEFSDNRTNFTIPANFPINASSYNYLSIRITKVFRNIPNLNNFTVIINNISYKVGDIVQDPDERFDNVLNTKNDLQTIIIPLSAFQGLNKSNITSIKLDFNTNSGRVAFADIEFINI